MKSQDNREYFEITFTVNGVLKSKQFFTETALDAICEAKAEFKKIEAERGLKIEYVDCIKLGDIYATEEKPTQPQEKTTMKTQTIELKTATIYGHDKHVYFAEKALESDVITSFEKGWLHKYTNAIFSGRHMDSETQTRGYDINKKVYAFVLKTRPKALKELLAQNLAKQLGENNYLDIAVYFDPKNPLSFEAIADNGNKFNGLISFNDHHSIEIKPIHFLNWVNQSLSVKTHREAKAEVTTLEDILDAMQYNSHEDLVASFEQTFNYDPELKIATFSGICASSESGFEICLNQEAHNIESEEQGRGVWGLDDNLMPSI